MSAFLDRVLLARAEEQAATATYRVRCVCCRVRQLDADESNGVCYACTRRLDPELRRAQNRAHKAASLARKRARQGVRR